MNLRERLAAAQRRTTTHPLRIEDDAAPRAELAASLAEGDEQRVAAARSAVDACHETLTIVALAPDDWEALVAAHPPTEQQKDAWWNPATFIPALLAECVASDVTAADWADYTTKGPMSLGEVTSLVNAALDVNHRVSDSRALGKGSTETRS